MRQKSLNRNSLLIMYLPSVKRKSCSVRPEIFDVYGILSASKDVSTLNKKNLQIDCI